MENKLRVNCKDTIFEIDAEKLTRFEDNALEAMVSGRHLVDQKDDLPFIDRDPQIFKLVVDYVNSDLLLPELTPG